MTDKEVIDSLRLCNTPGAACSGCAFKAVHGQDCYEALMEETLYRLERLVDEKERIKRNTTNSCDDWLDD